MPVLFVHEGPSKGKNLSLDLPRGQLICGSSPQATFQINDSSAAPQQFRLVKDGPSMVVFDLGSGVQTLVQGKPIQANQPIPIQIGDFIQIGGTLLYIAPSQGESIPPPQVQTAPPLASSIPAVNTSAAAAMSVPPSPQLNPQSLPQPAPAQVIGRSLGGCAISARIGEGYSSVVYAAQQVTMDRGVAVKVLKSELSSDPVFSSEFFRRAKAAGQYHHENVVQIFDVGIDSGCSFIVYEFFPGGSLAPALQRQGRFDWSTSLAITCDIAEALLYARTRALVHGAISPENVFRSDTGQAKLADLGVGGLRPAKVPVTAEKARYMAPEQCKGHLIDARTDIYALGVLFFRMLAGFAPYDAQDVAVIQQLHIAGNLPDFDKVIPGLPRNAAALLRKMLQANPDHRYISAEALITDLRTFGESPNSSPSAGAGRSRDAKPAAKARRAKSVTATPSGRERTKRVPKPKEFKDYAIPGGIFLVVAILVILGLSSVAEDPRMNRGAGTNTELSGGEQTLAKVQQLLQNPSTSRNDAYKEALRILDTESHRGRPKITAELESLHALVRQSVQEIPLAEAAVKEFNEYVDFEKTAGNAERIERINQILKKYENCVHDGIKGYCHRLKRRKAQVEKGEV